MRSEPRSVAEGGLSYRLRPLSRSRYRRPMPFLSSRRSRFLLLGAAFLAMHLHAQSPAVQQAFQRGATAMKAGQLPAAEAAFREAVRLAPTLAEAHLDLGLVLGREGKLADAAESIRHALKLNPQLPGAQMFLGIFLFQENQPDQARTALRDAVRAEPNNTEAMMWLANVELAAGNPARAAAALDRAAELQPDDLNILELRGKAHSEAARESYSRMAKLDPGSWHVHRVQAELDSSGGNHADAIKELLAATAQEQRNPDLYEMLGDEYRATSQLEAAESAYRQEQQLAPANPIALYNLGSTLVEHGDAEHGVPLLQHAADLYAGSPVVQYYLGRGLAMLARNEEAATVLAKAAAGDAVGEIGKRSYFELARVDRKLHRDTDAQTATANYNRIRLQQEQASSQQVQDWKKLQQSR